MDVIKGHLGIPKGIFLNGEASQKIFAYANGQLAGQLTLKIGANPKALKIDHIQETVVVHLYNFTKVAGSVATIKIVRVCACYMDEHGENVAAEPICREIDETLSLKYLGNNILGLEESK